MAAKKVEKPSEAQFFETVLRCVADGVFTVDCNWRITSFNKAAERITGVPAEEAVGRRCSEVFHADICESVCAIRQTLETGREVIDQPAKILNQRGRSIPISISTAVLRTEDGDLLGDPGRVEQSPYDEGWILRVRPRDLSHATCHLLPATAGRVWLNAIGEKLNEQLEPVLGKQPYDGIAWNDV